MINIYDNANEMATALQKTTQYTEWEDAFKAVQNDETSKVLFAQFQNIQMTVQQMMQSQEQPTADQEKEWDAVANQVQKNTLISELMSKEQALNSLLGELNDLVTRPISQAYANLKK